MQELAPATSFKRSGSGSRTTAYTYDSTYQLTAVDYPPGFDYLATDTTFNYDAAGNRSSVIDGSGTTPYYTNNLNQYTADDGTSYKYDTSGNMTYDGHNVCGYDPENRLIKVRKDGQGAEALSNATDITLTFTTGGDAPWFDQTAHYFYDYDAAQSGHIGDNQQSWLQTTVTGPGTFTFYWSASSGSGDYLTFYIDGVAQNQISGAPTWEQKTYTLTGSGTHTLKWVYAKDWTGSYGYDCGWVDKVTWQPAATPPDDLAAAVDSVLAYTTGGNGNWSAVSGGYYGGNSAASPSLSLNQESWMQTTVQGAGTFSFWAKLSAAYSDPQPTPPDQYAAATECLIPFTTGGDAAWQVCSTGGHNDWNSVYSGDLDANQSNWLQTTVTGRGTFSFWWESPSSDEFSEFYFYIDGRPTPA